MLFLLLFRLAGAVTSGNHIGLYLVRVTRKSKSEQRMAGKGPQRVKSVKMVGLMGEQLERSS